MPDNRVKNKLDVKMRNGIPKKKKKNRYSSCGQGNAIEVSDLFRNHNFYGIFSKGKQNCLRSKEGTLFHMFLKFQSLLICNNLKNDIFI